MLKNYKNFSQLLREQILEKNPNLLKEGLIFSWTYTKFHNKLEKLFEKYKLYEEYDYVINIKEDGVYVNISLREKNKKFFDDLYSFLNLSGYYISKYKTNNDDKFKNTNLDIKTYFDKNVSELSITFNKKFDFGDNGIKSKLYHITDQKYKDKISDFGLSIKSKKLIENHPDRIYLFDDINHIDTFIEQRKVYDENFVPLILQIDVKLCNKIKLYVDPKFPTADAFYTYDFIPPMAITEIKM